MPTRGVPTRGGAAPHSATVWVTWLVLGAVAAAGLADDADDRPPATGSPATGSLHSQYVQHSLQLPSAWTMLA